MDASSCFARHRAICSRRSTSIRPAFSGAAASSARTSTAARWISWRWATRWTAARVTRFTRARATRRCRATDATSRSRRTSSSTPQDANSATDVYVRDMSRPLDDSAAFELVSALDGSSDPPAYGDDDGASVASPGAISADGRTVVFATASQSNLPAGGAQIGAKQVLARELDGDRTILISEKRDSGTGAMTDEPAGSNLNSLPTARISADAATVVWAGNNAALQTRYVTGNVDADNRRELMWRRVAAGPQDRTRRVSGVDDPDDPACAPDGSITSSTNPVAGPCDGPLKGPHSTSDAIGGGSFAVSADGTKVAFTTSYISRASPETDTDHYDAFVSDMTPGLARKDGLQELTRESSTSTAGNVSGDIGNLDGISISISADGHWVAFPDSAHAVPATAADLHRHRAQHREHRADVRGRPRSEHDPARVAKPRWKSLHRIGVGTEPVRRRISLGIHLDRRRPGCRRRQLAGRRVRVGLRRHRRCRGRIAAGGLRAKADCRRRNTARQLQEAEAIEGRDRRGRAGSRHGQRSRHGTDRDVASERFASGSAISAEGETVTVTLGLSRRLARRAQRSSGLRTRVTLSFRAAGSLQAAAAKSLVVVFGGRPGAGS